MDTLNYIKNIIDKITDKNYINTNESEIRVLCPCCDGTKYVVVREAIPYEPEVKKECSNCKGTGIVEFNIKIWRDDGK